MGANKGAIVNIHKDTRSGGGTVIRVVVVTVVDSSDISGESLGRTKIIVCFLLRAEKK